MKVFIDTNVILDYKESTNGQLKIYTPQQFIDQELTE